MSQQNSSQKTGKFMYFMAWIAAMLLLTLWFDDLLLEQWNPNREPDLQSNGSAQQTILKRNRYGHYVTSGYINGNPVVFLLDTGATHVSIPAHLQQSLNLYPKGSSRVMTANGAVTVDNTVIAELEFGHIRLLDVKANLNPGMRGNEILLGMSALKQLEFTQRGDQLILKTY